MWRISFWLFFSIGYIIINNSIKADFNPYRPNRLHFHISIHAPRAGSDECFALGRAVVCAISIHAPRAGSDIDGEWLTTRETNFNPRSPCGERHYLKERPCDIWAFQSTLPVRGATAQR